MKILCSVSDSGATTILRPRCQLILEAPNAPNCQWCLNVESLMN
jgi:hypothetical protein